MSDIERAKENIVGHAICLCKGESIITDDGRGISPMMKFIGENKDLRGYSAADIIVGKAAAMLFVRAGVAAVHGKVMSKAGKEYLESHGISCTFDTLTDNIIDRSGKDICPMEKTVAHISEADEGYEALRGKIAEMSGKRLSNKFWIIKRSAAKCCGSFLLYKIISHKSLQMWYNKRN